MAKKKRDWSCKGDMSGCCQVESVVSMHERGQMVLPKDVREKVKIKAGDKLAVMSWGIGESSCVCLMKADQLNKMANEFLGPVLRG